MQSPITVDPRTYPSTARVIGQAALSGIVITAAGRAFNSVWDLGANLISRRKQRKTKKANA